MVLNVHFTGQKVALALYLLPNIFRVKKSDSSKVFVLESEMSQAVNVSIVTDLTNLVDVTISVACTLVTNKVFLKVALLDVGSITGMTSVSSICIILITCYFFLHFISVE